ncbi:D-hexose-6-phosphate mutarotase [Alteromonas mediterranea]|uniref:Putative glucose-6-phosphate 1-epimerase n=2 Tax=Alteromonas mediterranea TaxID=314275 RepID=A0AAC9JB14_9ALTE|nr:D-hexose-6-phosphate mutarotase [Alteromonas mediterranea]APD90246.1 D-hexose-6-phosphate mutarotase [Alteromonas mediterranea]APE02325.1 D-hexose-6-phosphate mutarotase [Alteromonas mediterranea]QGX62206.1 D-hexose-6-phosphate mutarotase [Alteromonas mediterranea]
MPPVSSVTVSESNGLTFLDVDNALATARISLFGGHILSYVPKSDDKERLWVSPHAYLNGERPIRGGIPVCWPWFSDDHGREKGALPSHGFLRTQVWKLIDSKDDDSGTTIELSPSFTRADGFENECNVSMVIKVGNTMDVSLITENTGVAPFEFNCALHTYFHVDHIQHTLISGIEGQYKDKLDNWALKATPTPYAITGETDRIHLAPIKTADIEVDGNAFTQVVSEGNDSLVVWNPWQSAASISDMDPFGYKHMLCVETSLTQGKTLAPSECHTLKQTIVPRQANV